MFQDMAFTGWVLEQEGVLDCRSREEKIEVIIQRLVEIGNHCGEVNEGHLLIVLDENHLLDLLPAERNFIISEVQYRCLEED